MEILFNVKNDCYFLLPDKVSLSGTGAFELYDTNGQTFLFDPDALMPYTCTKEQACEFLQKQWQDAVEQAKQAWIDLHNFSDQNNLDIELGTNLNAFDKIFDQLGLKEIKTIYQKEYGVTPRHLDEVLEENTEELVETVVGKMPDLMPFFSEEYLKKVEEDPEAWANEIYEKAYGELDQKKESEFKDKMAKDIHNSIARNLKK